MESNGDFAGNIGAYISEGWEIYKREPLLLSAATLLQIVLSSIAVNIPFANMVLYGPLIAGLYIMVMRLERGEELTFGNYFDGFKTFVPLALASVVTSLFISIGILLLVLPGIYLAIAYGFTFLNILDRKMDFWPAMETSRKVITAHFWTALGLTFLFVVLCLLGAIPFGLGLLVAIPVCIGAQYRFYTDLGNYYTSAAVTGPAEGSPASPGDTEL